MDEGDPDSKVSVLCFICAVLLVQAGNGDSTVTVTEETPTTKDSKVILQLYGYIVCMLLFPDREVFLC